MSFSEMSSVRMQRTADIFLRKNIEQPEAPGGIVAWSMPPDTRIIHHVPPDGAAFHNEPSHFSSVYYVLGR
jgi:hypothetical protein